MAPDESYIIFASQRRGGVGGLDLYITFKDGSAWSPPKLLPEPINSIVRDYCPIASPDGQWLYFSSDRGFADRPLSKAMTFDEVQHLMSSPGNSVGDVYGTALPELLK